MSAPMLIDTSVIVAIFEKEPEAAEFLTTIANASATEITAPSLVEAAMVLINRQGENVLPLLWEFIETANINITAFDANTARKAIEGFSRYGKGYGQPAVLNFGDCLVYGAAAIADTPLLFKGNDFNRTDLAVIIPNESKDNGNKDQDDLG